MQRHKAIALTALALSLLLFLLGAFLLHKLSIDDAAISWRYAQNLVNGHGLWSGIPANVQ